MTFIEGTIWLLLLLVRGLVLWLLVPFAVVAWVLVHWWAQRASIAQAICWHDQILVGFLVLVPFRMVMYFKPELSTTRFLRLSEMRDVENVQDQFHQRSCLGNDAASRALDDQPESRLPVSYEPSRCRNSIDRPAGATAATSSPALRATASGRGSRADATRSDHVQNKELAERLSDEQIGASCFCLRVPRTGTR